MLIKTVKQGLGLACMMAVLAGCSTTSTTDGSADGAADTASTSTGVTTGAADSASVETSGSYSQLDTVFYFDFNQSTLKAEARAALTAHAARLQGSAGSVRLDGHADEKGTREYNMALGERRANAVRDFLIMQGVSATRFDVVSFGEERPVGSDAENRRVELK